MQELEYELFKKTTTTVLKSTEILQSMAKAIAYIDCLSSFAHTAGEKKYCRPVVAPDKVILIKNGRHPVVEHVIGSDFVPNDTTMNQESRCMLLTGPNMAGKSTYIRQVSLIILLAHIGSYVPADSAIVPLTDRVFARIGASDALHKGLSTFMVEMTETAHILQQVTDKSFVILDEVGRGTGTSDGLSIAQAVAEHLAKIPEQPFVFFATHYHELADLSKQISVFRNYAMRVTVHKNTLIFLRKLEEGSTDESFGVEVAKHAGLPLRVVSRAEYLKNHLNDTARHQLNTTHFDQIIHDIQALHLDEVSPKKAWEILDELQKKIT